MKNEDVVAVAVAVDEPVSAEVLVNATNQRDSIVSSPVDEDGILALLNQHQWPLGASTNVYFQCEPRRFPLFYHR